MSVQGEANADFRDHLIRYGGDTYPEIVEKAQGCYVWDASGKKVLDFTSGQMCATVGHNHPNIVAAIRKSCDTALHLFSGMIPRSVVQLAEAIAKIVPKPLARSLFVNTGSESNEAAIKMAKLYTGGFEVVGSRRLVARRHGQRGLGVVRQRSQGLRTGHAGHVRAARAQRLSLPRQALSRHVRPHVHEGRLRALRHAIDGRAGGGDRRTGDQRRRRDRPAGRLLRRTAAGNAQARHAADLRRGANRVRSPRPLVRGVASESDAGPHDGSKTLGGGIPLAGVITTDAIEETCHARGFAFYTSHVSDPLPSTVGLAVLETIEQEDLLARSREMGDYLAAGLRELQRAPRGDR